jgi:sugar transferase (PEP-CTERM system associated)
LIRTFHHHIPRIAIVLLASDMAVLLASVGLTYWWLDRLGDGLFWPKIVAFASTIILLFYLSDLYNFQVQFGGGELVLRVGLASAIAAVLIAAIGYTVPPLRLGRMAFLAITVASTLGLMLFRLMTRHLISHQTLQKRVLVLGTALADVIIAWQDYHGPLPFRVIGFLDDDPAAQDDLLPGYNLLGGISDLSNVIAAHHPDILLVALTNMRGTLPITDMLECRFRGVRVEEWTSFFEKLTGRILVHSLRPTWLVFSDGAVNTRLAESIRRVLDVALSLIGLTLSVPFIGLAALCMKLDSVGPVLFRQERVGKDGGVFTLYKLRSMRMHAEQMTGPVWASEDDPRITRVGRVIRKIRLDEIPQMFNVLVGNMSFIGPRPERPAFVNNLKEQVPFYILRFAVKPGITGWAQVMYQYSITVEDALEKLQYDLYYAKNMSIFFDLLILSKSIQVVLFGRGAR